MKPVARVPITGNFVVDAGDVTLTVIIGEAHQGFTAALLVEEPVAEGETVQDVVIGSSAIVRGKVLFIDTSITVTNQLTTRTSVQFILRQGNMERSYPGSRTLTAIGDSVIYEGEIHFQ